MRCSMKFFTSKQIKRFNDLDYNIFNFVTSNPEKVPYMTIRELAEEAHVSTASITRFCQKLDCEGFTEFKLKFKLQKDQTRQVSFSNNISNVESFLLRMKEASYEADILKLANVLAESKSLVFVGLGNSGVMASYAARYFSSAGKFALSIENPMYVIDIADQVGTAIVFLSVEGELSRDIETLAKLKSTSNTIVSITNSKNSTLAKLSDYNLATHVIREENRDNHSLIKVDITTQVPVMLLIETLAKEVHDIIEKKK